MLIIKPKSLFPKRIVAIYFLVTILAAWLSGYFNHQWIGYLGAIIFIVFVLVNFDGLTKTFQIVGNKIIIGKREYLIPKDLKKYEIKNEILRIIYQKLDYQIFVLYFKDNALFVISSKSFGNYFEIKDVLLKLINNEVED